MLPPYAAVVPGQLRSHLLLPLLQLPQLRQLLAPHLQLPLFLHPPVLCALQGLAALLLGTGHRLPPRCLALLLLLPLRRLQCTG